MASNNLLLTYAEVAEAERTSTAAIRMRVHRGRLPVEKNGGSPRVPLRALSPTAQARALELIQLKRAA